jgi:hypothetical protein
MTDSTRRQLLKMGAVLTVPLAGCSSGDDTTTTPSERSEEAPETAGDDTPSRTQTEMDDATETPTDQPQATSVSVGEIVAGDQLSLVVRSVTKTDSLGEFQNADSGNTYAVVRVVVKNTTQSQFANFSSFLQTELQDSEGYTYTPALSLSDSAFQGGQFAPGETARGDIAFEVPQDATDLTLNFDFRSFSFTEYDRVTIDLSSTASTRGDLEQSLRVPIHGLSDSVTHDGITVTVHSVEFESSLGEYTQAPEGREYALVDITTANGRDETTSFSSLLQMSMKNGAGREFGQSAVASGRVTQAYSGGNVPPGERVRGKVVFEVPRGESPLYFTFAHSVLSGGRKSFWQLR